MNTELFTEAFSTNLVFEKETAGIVTNCIEVKVEVKGENGEKQLVSRTLSNPVAVASINDIAVLRNVSKMSLKATTIAMARITDEHAKSIGLKSARQLLKNIFSTEYSDNTISKYRRIGLIFGDLVKEGYHWRDGIDEYVSVSNLDAVITLCECDNAEELTAEELTEIYNKFYRSYIASDRVHLLYSQSDLKKEVKEIKNPSIVVEAKEVTETETAPETATETAPETAPETEITPEVAKADARQSATECIEYLSILMKSNKTALKLLSQLAKELDKTEIEVEIEA